MQGYHCSDAYHQWCETLIHFSWSAVSWVVSQRATHQPHTQRTLFEERWDKEWYMCASDHPHAVDHSQHDAEQFSLVGHEFANSSLWRRMCRKTSPTSLRPLSNPACANVMISAVKTKCMHLLLHALSYGRSLEADVGKEELGRSRCLVWRKLNNFKVHLVKRCKTYFNTFFTLALSLLVGTPPLYVCLRQCERAKVCVILLRILILLHLRSQTVSCWNKIISGIRFIMMAF